MFINRESSVKVRVQNTHPSLKNRRFKVSRILPKSIVSIPNSCHLQNKYDNDNICPAYLLIGFLWQSNKKIIKVLC